MAFLNYCNLYLKQNQKICCDCINILVRHYGRLVLPWGTEGQHQDIMVWTDQWLWLTFSLHINQILWNWDLFHRVPLSQNDKDFSAPLFLLSALLALYCSIFLKRVLNSTSDKCIFCKQQNWHLKSNFEKCCQFRFCSNCHFEIQLFPISRLNCLHNEFEIGSI